MTTQANPEAEVAARATKVTINLEFPLEVGGSPLDVLTLPEILDGESLWECPLGSIGIEQAIAIGVRAAGIPPEHRKYVEDELTEGDLGLLQEYVADGLVAAKLLGLDLETDRFTKKGQLPLIEPAPDDGSGDGPRIMLKHGMRLGKRMGHKLKFPKRLKGKHLRGALPPRDLTIGNFLSVAANMTGVTDSQIRSLQGEDLGAAVEVVQAFLGRARAIGARS